MKAKQVLIFFLWVSVSITDVYAQKTKADIIIINANVFTLDERHPQCEAVAVFKNRILATGSSREILKLRKASTKIIDAKGKTVIPGLFDSHLHVIRAGRYYNSELRWDGVKTLKRALEMLKEQAERTPAGQWVRVVGGWSQYQFEERRPPSLREINDATGDVPTFILYLYGKAWLNQAGLKALDINNETPNPEGGLIEKDDAGNPTGLLVAEPNAYILYSTLARLPELSYDEKINSTLQYMKELNRLGVTAVMDAGGGFQNFPDDYAITDSLNRAGLITLRIPYFLFAQKKGHELTDYRRWINTVNIQSQSTNNKNTIDYKVEGGGENLLAEAADFENFLFPRPNLPVSMESNLEPLIKLLAENQWPFRLHATYNESISRDLDVIESVRRATPLDGLTFFFDHAETISEENLTRIKTLGGGVAVQHRMAYQGESFIHRYGKKAAGMAPPVKKMIEMGLPVGLGTDGTRVASYNPWVALYWITTGKSVGGTQILDKENILDRVTALKLATIGGYALIKEHDSKGKIVEGFFADVVILDRDYFTIPGEEIKSISSLLTIVDGKIVWADGDFKSLLPDKLPVIPFWSPIIFYGGYQKQ